MSTVCRKEEHSIAIQTKTKHASIPGHKPWKMWLKVFSHQNCVLLQKRAAQLEQKARCLQKPSPFKYKCVDLKANA